MEKQCSVCRETKTVDATPEQVAAWKAGALIQNAMPNVPKDQRELLMSGICGTCFDRMFRDDEETGMGRDFE